MDKSLEGRETLCYPKGETESTEHVGLLPPGFPRKDPDLGRRGAAPRAPGRSYQWRGPSCLLLKGSQPIRPRRRVRGPGVQSPNRLQEGSEQHNPHPQFGPEDCRRCHLPHPAAEPPQSPETGRCTDVAAAAAGTQGPPPEAGSQLLSARAGGHSGELQARKVVQPPPYPDSSAIPRKQE